MVSNKDYVMFRSLRMLESREEILSTLVLNPTLCPLNIFLPQLISDKEKQWEEVCATYAKVLYYVSYIALNTYI